MLADTTLPLLYSYRRCPYAMRARLAMLQAQRRFQTYEIVMRDKPAEMLALSPKGTVPVLRLPDGTVLEESLDIMRWALEQPDTDGWWRRAQSADNLRCCARTMAISNACSIATSIRIAIRKRLCRARLPVPRPLKPC